jgi:hypothetical protein
MTILSVGAGRLVLTDCLSTEPDTFFTNLKSQRHRLSNDIYREIGNSYFRFRPTYLFTYKAHQLTFNPPYAIMMAHADVFSYLSDWRPMGWTGL